MPSQFFGLNIGASGLSAFQAAINTTAHNISNVQTEGYSRQSTTIEATSPLRVYAKYGSTGTGVAAIEVKQQRDLYYDKKYHENNCSLGYYEQKLYYLGQIEGVFSDDSVQEGFASIFSKMFNSLDTLHGGNASNASIRNQFINRAQTLCTYFNSVSDSLREMQRDTNEEIISTVHNINAIGEKISLINKEINELELNGGYANELRDQRGLLLDELSAIVDVSTDEYAVKNTYGQDLGGTNFAVFINGQLLVDGNDYRQLECISATSRRHQTDAEGMYDIKWSDTKGDFAATTATANGTLKALFDLRDGNNNEAMSGTADAVADADGNYTSIVLSTPSNTTVNALNIPPQGTIEVNNNTFVYTGWEAKLDDEGKIVDITFELKEPIDPLVAVVLDNYRVVVGENVNSMGIPYYQQQINEFLRNFTEMFNDIQREGQTPEGEQMGSFFVSETETGTMYDFDEWGTPENRSDTISSESDGYHQMTAFRVKVNDRSMREPYYFATTKDVTNGADATDILDRLMTLQDDVVMFRGDVSSTFLETLLSDISVDTEKTGIFRDNYQNMNTVISNQRLSVSGVDEDEEALNLVKFQNAYNLNAKVISVLTEIYDKLINETGVT